MLSLKITESDALLNFRASIIVAHYLHFLLVKFQMQSQMVFTINYITLIVTYS